MFSELAQRIFVFLVSYSQWYECIVEENILSTPKFTAI